MLPEGIQRSEGPPPPPPVDFEDNYVLPEHSVKPLSTLHSHPLDARLIFYEIPHVYTVDGVPTSTSVTALAHAYERPFVPAAIGMMKGAVQRGQGRNTWWTHTVRPATWTPDRGVLAVVGGKTVAVVHPHSLGPGATAESVDGMLRASTLPSLKAFREEGEEERVSYERELTDEEIAAGWALKGKIASHAGTEAHWLCECFLNGLPVRWWEPEMAVLFDFARKHMIPRGIVAYNTEKEIVCLDADVAGSIDLIVYEPATKMHHIIDFKRSDKLKTQMRGFGKMEGEFSHLDDSKGASYALQTSIYQFILEREYGMSIGDRILLSIHPDQPFATSVPYLKAEVEFLMGKRFALVAARRKARDANPEAFTCALTGAPIVDAVKLVDEEEEAGTETTKRSPRYAMEKAALVRDLAFVVDDDAAALRCAFDAAVEACVEPVQLAKQDCVAWRKRMPEGGLEPFA